MRRREGQVDPRMPLMPEDWGGRLTSHRRARIPERETEESYKRFALDGI